MISIRILLLHAIHTCACVCVCDVRVCAMCVHMCVYVYVFVQVRRWDGTYNPETQRDKVRVVDTVVSLYTVLLVVPLSTCYYSSHYWGSLLNTWTISVYCHSISRRCVCVCVCVCVCFLQQERLKEDVRPLKAYPVIYLVLSIFPLVNRYCAVRLGHLHITA